MAQTKKRRRKMAQVRIDSGDVIEDSYILLAYPTVRQAEVVAKEMQRLKAVHDKLAQIANDEPTDANLEHLSKAQDALNAYSKEMLAGYIIEWDWVDMEGEPLPSPHNNPAVFNELTAAEIQWLTEAIMGISPKKN